VVVLVVAAHRGGGDMSYLRVFKHLLHFPWQVHRAFPARTMHAIEAAILNTEQHHAGELRFAVEGALDLPELFRGMTARERALEVFGNLRVWDTEHNNGVLIYLLLADHDVEIIADRGIHQRIATGEWEKVCRAMEALLRQGQYEAAVLQGVALVGVLLQQHYPAAGKQRNELDNRPVVVKR
jgi:uncharacterized membrane protein